MHCCDYRSTVAHTMLYLIRYHFKKIPTSSKSVDIFCFKDLFHTYVIKKTMKAIRKIETLSYDKPIENLNGSAYILYTIPRDTKIMYGQVLKLERI